ncbi:hypothetical protein LZP73_16605 [Shewanella sp. AS16]|uniref:hypothetical protein n=1 Tax=Shewanella sp. AS16 TaxID=2907625 RepID=UPI001F35653D|nr:hypothetical protein [Shewanella sp. AS16]MCE9687803.1 hypothetical protein [Shewanella sp. AS16]
MFTDANPYFSVPHNFAVYLSPWPEDKPLPSESSLRAMQSQGMQLLTEAKALEAHCLLQLRQLDNEAKAVVDFLKIQSRKVDLVLQYVLEREHQQGDKYIGMQFGGSGLVIATPAPLPIGSQHQLMLYIHDELVAILCIASVSSSVEAAPVAPINGDTPAPCWHTRLDFSQILDADVEQLVKASLNVQQKQLKQRKQAREQAGQE